MKIGARARARARASERARERERERVWPFRSLTNCSSSVLVLSGKEHNTRNSNERKEDRHFLYILKRRGSGGKREAKTILKRL